MKIGFTGHRPPDLARTPAVLPQLLPACCEEIAARWPGAVWLCGGASGVDEAVAQQAIRLRQPFELHLPFPAPVMWQEGYIDEASYRVLLGQMEQAAAVVHLHPAFDPHAYEARNHSLADNAELLIAFWNGNRQGGTFQTIAFARERGIPVMNGISGQLEEL